MTHKGQPDGLQTDQLEQFTHTDNGVMGVDAHQRIILWNRIAEALLGYQANEVLGKHCYEVFMATDECGTLTCCEACPQIIQAAAEPARTLSGDVPEPPGAQRPGLSGRRL